MGFSENSINIIKVASFANITEVGDRERSWTPQMLQMGGPGETKSHPAIWFVESVINIIKMEDFANIKEVGDRERILTKICFKWGGPWGYQIASCYSVC